MPGFDVEILGGGPAGASVAIRLARLGYRVAVFDVASTARQHVAESLPASLRVVLRALEVDLPDAVVVERPPEHRVYWGSVRSETRRDVPDGEGSLLVWRGAFDDHLRRAAVEAGVAWIEGRRPAGRPAGFLIDASGRAGALSRPNGWREHEPGFQTLALTGHFRLEAAPSPGAPTLIEAFERGFAWSAPLRSGLRDVTVFVDAGAKLSDYDDFLGLAPRVRELVAGAAMCGPVRAADATPYVSRSYGSAEHLLVGDAAVFLDPLSAHGVHKAMDGGLVAAAVVRTLLERPGSREDALAFYRERESRIARITSEKMAKLYARETRYRSHPFWRKRSRDGEGAPVAPALPPPLPPLSRAGRLVPVTGVEVRKGPVLEDDYIVSRRVLVAPGSERPVRFLGGHCLPDLYEEVLSRGLEAMLRDAGRRGLFDAVDWLYRSGYVRPDRDDALRRP